tara:strand:+ start:4070 stop:10990 length:6921 start_codon:yes stop_codon:yes gene_type:complete
VSTQAEWNLEDWFNHKVNDPSSNPVILTETADKEIEYTKEEVNMETLRFDESSVNPDKSRLSSTHHYNSFEYPTDQTFDIAYEISKTCDKLNLGLPKRHAKQDNIFYEGTTVLNNRWKKIYMKKVKENELWCSIPDIKTTTQVNCAVDICGLGVNNGDEIHKTAETYTQFFTRVVQTLEINFADVMNYTDYVSHSGEVRQTKKVVERGDPGALCTMWNTVATGGIRYGAFDIGEDSCASIGWETPTKEECRHGGDDGKLTSSTSYMMAWWYNHETQPAKYNCNDYYVDFRTPIGDDNMVEKHPQHYTHQTGTRSSSPTLCKLDVRDKADKLSLLEKTTYTYHLNEMFRAQIALRLWAEENCQGAMCMLGAHNIEKIDMGMAIPLFIIPVDVGYSYYELQKSGYTFTYSQNTKVSYCYNVLDEHATLGGAKVSASPAGFPSPKKLLTAVDSKIYNKMASMAKGSKWLRLGGNAGDAKSISTHNARAVRKGRAATRRNFKKIKKKPKAIQKPWTQSQNKMRKDLDNRIHTLRKYKRYGVDPPGFPILKKADVLLVSKMKSKIFQYRAMISRTLSRVNRMYRRTGKAGRAVKKKSKGAAESEASDKSVGDTAPTSVEVSFWYETGSCSNPPCVIQKKFTGFSTDNEALHESIGTPGMYEWYQVSIEASFFTASAKAVAFRATNNDWVRTLFHTHCIVSAPTAIEMGLLAIGGIYGLATELMITFELGAGRGILSIATRNLQAYAEKLNDHALNPIMTSANCIEDGCGDHAFVSDQIKLNSSAETFMNIPLTHYRDENTDIVEYTDTYIPSVLPGELSLLGLAQGNSNSNLTMKCVSGNECTINEEGVTFDKYSALQPGVPHFELNVSSFNQLSDHYIYPLEARGILDSLTDHPYYNDPMIGIVSDETCETFGLTPILDIDNNNAVKNAVQKLFDQNTVLDPYATYAFVYKHPDRDINQYTDENTRQIWSKTEIVSEFSRDDVVYDQDDLIEETDKTSHNIRALEYSYIPPGLTIVSEEPYIMDRKLYIVQKDLNPLGFRSQKMYGNAPSHIAKCTNQFRCICFKGNEYTYIRKNETHTVKNDTEYDYMEQPVHSLHECKIAAGNYNVWKTPVDYNTGSLGEVNIVRFTGTPTFGCRLKTRWYPQFEDVPRKIVSYVFNDVPYNMEPVYDDDDNLVLGTNILIAKTSRSDSVVKIIRRKKINTGTNTMNVLTRDEGARKQENEFDVTKTHIWQNDYSYIPIYRDYTKIKYRNTTLAYRHTGHIPTRLIQQGESYFFNNNGYVEEYNHSGQTQADEYGDKPNIGLIMHSINNTTDSVPQIIKDTPEHIYNTDWDGILVDVDIFNSGVLVGGAHTKLTHIACRPIVYLKGEQSYYRLKNGGMVYLPGYGDLDDNTDARLCGHLPDTTVTNSISCELSHSFPNQCPEGYGLGFSMWDGTYDHTTDTGDVPFVNGIYRQCSKCPEGTTSPDGHTRCLGHEHKLGESTLFDDPYSAYVHATHLQKYHFEEGNDYHPFYHTVGDIDYIDNEVYSDTRYLICDGGFVPKRQAIQDTWSSSCNLKGGRIISYLPRDTCEGFTSTQTSANVCLLPDDTAQFTNQNDCSEFDAHAVDFNSTLACTTAKGALDFTNQNDCSEFATQNFTSINRGCKGLHGMTILTSQTDCSQFNIQRQQWSSSCTLPDGTVSDLSREDCVTRSFKNTCSGYTCERCPKQFIELQQMCVPCPPGSVAGWALNSTTNPNVCVGVDVPVGHFFDSQNPDGPTVGGTNYPYATHCDHWLYHPEGGKGAYQNETNQTVCKTAIPGSMAGFNGRVIKRPSDPGQKVNNDRTDVINCKNHQVCDGEQIIGCAPGYIWYRQTDNRQDEECTLCNQEDIDHDEKDDYEYCDGTHRFQCADASYTAGTLQDAYVGVRDTWDGSNLVSYESQDETSPEGGDQYTYNTTWDISQARVQKNLKWDGSDAVCKAVPDGFFALDGEWKLHDCGYARDKCIHRTFHRIYPFRHPTNLAAKYMFTEAVRETSYDEIFRMSSRQCDDGFLKDGCLKEYCSREGQTNCWCGEEEDFCKFACVDGMCLPSCGDQVCNPNYEICYGIGVDAECTRKCNGPMDNYCVADRNGYARLCRHYNEDWNTTKFAYLEPSSPCFEEMPNIPETQCKSTTDRNCFCGRVYHDDKHKACKDREIVSSCSVIQDDGTCTYMTDSICLCGNDMINVISETCYQMNGQCGPYGNYIPDCDFHLEKITNTLTQNTTECRPTGKEALINPTKCRKGVITKNYTGTIDNIEEKFECVGDESDEPGCMDRHAKNYNQYAVIPKKCEY